MKHLSDLDRYLARLLFGSGRGLDAFTLFRRSKAGFSVFMKSVARLKEGGVVVEQDGNISLTQHGREMILLSGAYGRRNAEWRKVPQKMLRNRIDASEFYIPSRKLLDRRTFNFVDEDI